MGLTGLVNNDSLISWAVTSSCVDFPESKQWFESHTYVKQTLCISNMLIMTRHYHMMYCILLNNSSLTSIYLDLVLIKIIITQYLHFIVFMYQKNANFDTYQRGKWEQKRRSE